MKKLLLALIVSLFTVTAIAGGGSWGGRPPSGGWNNGWHGGGSWNNSWNNGWRGNSGCWNCGWAAFGGFAAGMAIGSTWNNNWGWQAPAPVIVQPAPVFVQPQPQVIFAQPQIVIQQAPQAPAQVVSPLQQRLLELRQMYDRGLLSYPEYYRIRSETIQQFSSLPR